MIHDYKPPLDEDTLIHFGVKGMKWGVRHDPGHVGERAKTKKIVKLDKKFERDSKNFKTYMSVHNRAAELTNKNDIDRINNKAQYKDADFSTDSPIRREYYREHQAAFVANVRKAAVEVGTNASGTRTLAIKERPDGDWEMHVVDVKHTDEPDLLDLIDGSTIQVFYDDRGHITRIEPPEDLEQSAFDDEEYLMHFGVKGMKWGTRKNDLPGVPRSTNREARKDAAEFARAKMFYGEGAGTRRKLIKASVEAKAKKDPTYQAAFDHHLGQQDLSTHASKARTERRRKDVKAGVGKNARAVNRAINGPFAGPVAATVLLGAYGAARASGLDKKAMNIGRSFINQQRFGTKVDLSFLK